jgi:hypothetical protein
MIDHVVRNVVKQVNHLLEKYQSLSLLKQKVLEEIPALEERIAERLEGSIVYKKICCHKAGCRTCGGTENAHGPYPHLQWRDERGVLKTRYISRKNLPYFREQLELSRKLARDLRLLSRIQDRQSRILRTLENVNYQLQGKEVNRDVRAS